MRITCSTGVMNTLPSPILPVRAARSTTLHRRFDQFVGQHDLHLQPGQEIHAVRAVTINLRVRRLVAETFDLAQGHAFDAEVGQRRP